MTSHEAKPIKIIHTADLHLGVETYGRVDPATGLSSRFNDFLAALDQLVQYALDEKADLVLICGDAYKSRSPSQTQQRELARRINRLASAGVAVFILVGNHDLPNAVGRATSTEIFDTLAVKNVYVSSRPEIINIETANGPVQVASLPWLRRGSLLAQLSKDDISGLSFEELNKKIEELLTAIIQRHARDLDPEIPSLMAAHIWVAKAQLGSERNITIGQEQTLLLSNVANPAFDYVALGHIHKHQVLSEHPPVVYSGSLEHLDFGEAKDEKGFYVVEIESSGTGQRKTSYEFHRVEGRPFVTIGVTLDTADAFPTEKVLQAIAASSDEINDAIVRLDLTLPAELEGQLNNAAIKEAMKEAHHITISRDIKRQARLRLGGQSAEKITPMEALKAYLEGKNVSEKHARLLLEHGRKLLEEMETA
jgi:exonuclease SbcD